MIDSAKKFSDEAKEAERRMFDDEGNLRMELLPESDPVKPSGPVAEEPKVEAEVPTEAQPEPVKPDPKIVEEDKYKSAVKAMNEAQREAADLRKSQKDQADKHTELEARLNAVIEERKKDAAKVHPADDLERDLPDVVEISERKANRVQEVLDPRITKLEKQLDEFNAERKKSSEERASVLMREEVLKAHSDFDTVVNSEEMNAWINSEAPPIYKSIYEGGIPFTAKDVIQVVNHYKSTLAPTKVVSDTPNDKVAAVKTVVTPSSKGNKPAPVTDSEMQEFTQSGHRWDSKRKEVFNERLNAMFS